MLSENKEKYSFPYKDRYISKKINICKQKTKYFSQMLRNFLMIYVTAMYLVIGILESLSTNIYYNPFCKVLYYNKFISNRRILFFITVMEIIVEEITLMIRAVILIFKM